MKKISMFMLMIFGMFMLFAQDAAPETAQENAVAPETAQTPAETAPEQAQPAENTAEPVETAPETTQEPVQTAETPAEQNVETSPETPAETAEQKVETEPETSQETAEQDVEKAKTAKKSKKNRSEKPQKIKMDRPYAGAGIPLIAIGAVSFAVMMPAMGAMAFAASDACEGKHWGFCEELHDNNKKHHTAWTVGAVMTGVVGAGMIVVGSWMTSVKKPKENQCVELKNMAVLPTKEGMYASIGFGF